MKINYEANRAWRRRCQTPLKRSRIKRRSQRHQRETRNYVTVRADYLERHPYCHHCLEKGVERPKRANEVHHTAGKHGAMLHDTRFFMAVASECHTIYPESIHENVADSRERGWLLPRGASMERKLEILDELRGEFDWVRMEVG